MKTDYTQTQGTLLALLAAALYAISTPFSRLLLKDIPPALLAGLLYIGAGLGMLVIWLCRRGRHLAGCKGHLTRRDRPYTLGMIVLDIAAPILLMLGLRETTAATASLLNNFEIVATALIARLLFAEDIRPRLWAGILSVTTSCILLSVESLDGLHFSAGSVLILLAALCWGLENNCTRMLSSRDPMEIVLLKGIFSGSGSLLIGLGRGERCSCVPAIAGALLLGLIAYGMSIFAYVYAQRAIGASRTSACYGVAPFIGSLLSLLLLHELPGRNFPTALLLMIVGVRLSSENTPLPHHRRIQRAGSKHRGIRARRSS